MSDSAFFRPRRSALYVPANRQRIVDKAADLKADVIILDLEDAVAPEAKAEARINAARAAKSGRFAGQELVIRINGLDTSEAAADLVAAVNADAVLVPKVNGPEDIRRALAGLNALAPAKLPALWAMIETPRAILNIAAIAAEAEHPDTRLTCFVLGANDLAKDTRIQPTASRLAMLPWISQTVLAARAFDLVVLDGVYNSFKDMEGFQAECRQGRGLGFDGKTLIHPDQIALANQIFSPSEAEIAEAKAIVAAFALPENSGKGVITINGRMTEVLHLEMAKRVLAQAAR